MTNEQTERLLDRVENQIFNAAYEKVWDRHFSVVYARVTGGESWDDIFAAAEDESGSQEGVCESCFHALLDKHVQAALDVAFDSPEAVKALDALLDANLAGEIERETEAYINALPDENV